MMSNKKKMEDPVLNHVARNTRVCQKCNKISFFFLQISVVTVNQLMLNCLKSIHDRKFRFHSSFFKKMYTQTFSRYELSWILSYSKKQNLQSNIEHNQFKEILAFFI